MDAIDTITPDGEVLEQGALAVIGGEVAAELSRAEIAQQVATAHQFPRSVTKAIRNITSLATLDEQAAQESIYALPRGGKPIRGPSIRLAEIVAQQWGNNRVASRVTKIDRAEKVIVAEAVFHDLETNAAVKSEVRRRISDRGGRILNDDMIVVTGNAAGSIARRNAILAGVPKGVWRKAYEAAEGVVKGDVKTLAERRAKAIAAFGTWGVKPEQIFAVLGVAGEEEVTLEHIPTLIGMFQSIKNGEETVESLFSPRAVGKAFDKVADPLNDAPAAPRAAAPNPDAPPSGSGEPVRPAASGEAAGAPPGETPAADQPRGHSREAAEADRVVDGAGRAVKSRGPDPDDDFPGNDAIAEAESRGRGAPAGGRGR